MIARVLMTLAIVVVAVPANAADAPAKANYKDNVAAIFQARCNACHNNDKQKGGLVLDNYGGALKGGGSGKVIEPGDPDNSRLYLLVTHAEEPKMPPMQPKLPDAELALIKAWIAAGAPEAAGSAVAMPAKPKLDFKLDPAAVGKPVGPPAVPEGVSTEPVVLSARPNVITALASSPWAPIVAVSGHKQVLVYNTANRRLVAVLPFPEGTIHSLKFSRDGGMLLAGGGRGGQLGRVVVWDVKSGKRLFEVGKEYDVVLAADISPDRSMVALGGPSKILRVYGTSDGELIYEQKKHTEWVTAVEFSPDGVLLASGDRNGGLVVWEAPTGREFYDLRAHTACITDVSWRLDSNLLASCSEDTTIRLWEMQNGGNIKGWGAHGGGVASVKFAKDGRLISTGRDRVAKLWDQNGAAQRQFEAFTDLALRAVFSFDDANVIAGDWSGEVRIWEMKEGKRVGNLVANPAALAVRLEQAKQAWTAAQTAADAAAKELATLQASAGAANDSLAKAQKALADAQQTAAATSATVGAAENVFNQKAAVERGTADALWVAQYREGQLTAIKADADKAFAERTAAVAAAASTLAETKTERDKVLSDEAVAAQAGAQQAATNAATQLAGATAATATVKAAAEKATAERVAADAPLPNLRTVAKAAADAVPARQNELNVVTAAKAAADKALAEKKPAAQALAAQAAAKKADAEALAVEKKANDPAKAGTATASATP
jgi:mono/diheme cytochrome c family protein